MGATTPLYTTFCTHYRACKIVSAVFAALPKELQGDNNKFMCKPICGIFKKYTLGLLGSYANTAMTGSLIFYSLFVMSAKPQLAPTIPFVLFGIFRYQYIVEKLGMGESPPDVLLKDWQLLLTVVLWVISCIYFLFPTYCLNPLFFAPCNNGV